jgi:AraC-like DNA-binding protein
MISNFVTIQVDSANQSMHWRKELSLYLVLRGKISIVINHREEKLLVGDICAVNYEDVHAVKNVSRDAVYLCLLLNVKSFNKYIPEISSVVFNPGGWTNDPFSFGLKDEIKNWICKIAKQSIPGAMGVRRDESSVIYACTEILSCLKLGFNMSGKRPDEYRTKEQFDRMWRVVDYIYENYEDKLTLTDIADFGHCSLPHMTRIIKEATGMSFESFLGYVRAESSIKSLLDTDKSITDISYEHGFSAPRYYNATFAKHYNMSPKEYRKQNKMYFKNDSKSTLPVMTFSSDISQDIFLSLLDEYMGEECEKDGTLPVGLGIGYDEDIDISNIIC